MRQNEKDLADHQFWVFSSGPSGEGDPVELLEGKLVPSDLQATIDRTHPRDVTVFNGNVNLEKINAIEKWAIKSVVKKPFGDYRNWDAIVSWADRIAATVK